MTHYKMDCPLVQLGWIFICLFIKLASPMTRNESLSENSTSVERSVSVSFDNTKIYFFGDKIEFAGEVHNRYPDGTNPENVPVSSETDENGHVLRRWGAPIPPGLRPSRPMPRVHYVDAECQNDYMKISILFNGSFNGMIYSSRYAYNPDCLYINGTGAQRYEFYIRLNRCGTLGGGPKGRTSEDDDKKMMWNTLTVQYNPLIEEEWDQHFRVTCEYGYQYWKKVSFPVVDVRVPTESPLLFTLSPPECQMEIRAGFNLNGQRISGPVNVGDPLTLVIYMRSPTVGFDIIINNCHAHNGANKRMSLIDEHGCPVENKIISDFKGVDIHHGVYESKVYAYFKAFRFTGSPALYIECDVRMCHGICPKQRCYWRNLRGRTEEEILHGRLKNATAGNETDSNNETLTSSDENESEQGFEYFTTSVFPSTKYATISNNNTDKTTQAFSTKSMPPFLATKTMTSATSDTTGGGTFSSSSSSSSSPPNPTAEVKLVTSDKTTWHDKKVTFKPTLSLTERTLMTTKPTTIILPSSPTTSAVTSTVHLKRTTVGIRPKSDLTSMVNLNINSRRYKRHTRKLRKKEDVNNNISETVNLFQALEVRSEPVEEVSKYRGIEENLVCIRTVGFTAIVSILVLMLILVTSVSCMLCARLRRLQCTNSDLSTFGKCYANHDIIAAIKVHRTS